MLTSCILLMTSFLQDFNWLAGSIDFVACVRVRVSNTSDCLYLGYGVWGVEGPLHYPLQLACILFPPMFSSRFLGLNSFACFVNYVDLLRVPLFYLHRGFSLSFCLVPISIWRFPHILRFLNITAFIYNIDIRRFWIIRLSSFFYQQVQAGRSSDLLANQFNLLTRIVRRDTISIVLLVSVLSYVTASEARLSRLVNFTPAMGQISIEPTLLVISFAPNSSF